MRNTRKRSNAALKQPALEILASLGKVYEINREGTIIERKIKSFAPVGKTVCVDIEGRGVQVFGKKKTKRSVEFDGCFLFLSILDLVNKIKCQPIHADTILEVELEIEYHKNLVHELEAEVKSLKKQKITVDTVILQMVEAEKKLLLQTTLAPNHTLKIGEYSNGTSPAEVIRNYRLLNNLSFPEMAVALDISRQELGRFINGYDPLTRILALKIETVFKINAKTLMDMQKACSRTQPATMESLKDKLLESLATSTSIEELNEKLFESKDSKETLYKTLQEIFAEYPELFARLHPDEARGIVVGAKVKMQVRKDIIGLGYIKEINPEKVANLTIGFPDGDIYMASADVIEVMEAPVTLQCVVKVDSVYGRVVDINKTCKKPYKVEFHIPLNVNVEDEWFSRLELIVMKPVTKKQ